jgi:hypothetical protein
MSGADPAATRPKARSTAWQTPLTTLQEVEPPFIPAERRDDRRVPARHAAAPALRPGLRVRAGGLLEIEGQPQRPVAAGEAFWESGGDVIHYQDGNNRDDVPLRFTVTMLCEPGRPMLTLVDEAELARREHLRTPRNS